MVIITADIQYKPQQEIVRDVSMFQVASEEGTQAKQNQQIREFILGECQKIDRWVASLNYPPGSSAIKAAKKDAITDYLTSLNHPIASRILKEYEAKWAKGRYEALLCRESNWKKSVHANHECTTLT
jgi:hypothetical protein